MIDSDPMLLGFIIAMVGLTVGAWFGLPFFVRSVQNRRIVRICRERRLIALTFDDGPCPGMTEKVLDLLDELQIKATFFVIGNLVRENDPLLDRIQRDGHHVASHTQHHLDCWKVGPIRGVRDFLEGVRTLRDRELAIQWFRPPKGNATLGTLMSCWLRGCKMIWWTHDSGDTGFGSGKSAMGLSEIVQKMISGGKRMIPEDDVRRPEMREDLLCSLEVSGGVVLLHDGERRYESCKELTLECTRDIVNRARRNEFQFVTLKELK